MNNNNRMKRSKGSNEDKNDESFGVLDIEQVAEEVEKRKHTRDPFASQYLHLTLSSFDRVCHVERLWCVMITM